MTHMILRYQGLKDLGLLRLVCGTETLGLFHTGAQEVVDLGKAMEH